MEMLSKKFPWHRGVLPLLAALVFGLAQQVSAQSNPITNYNNLVNDLNSGVTTITNFQPVTTISLTTTAETTIQITNNITIDAGTSSVLFQGSNLTRFFYVHPGAALTLNNLELTGGGSTNGGAIYNEGTLIISNCLLTGNMASNSSGASGGSVQPGFNGNGTNGGSGGNAAGGAIYSTGPLIILYSILTNNTAQAGSGGNGGNAGGEVGNGGSAGYGGNAYGGAMYSTGSSNVIYMTEFVDNDCFAGSGGFGGSFATNAPPFEGSGGAAGLGGSCAGGAAFVNGSLYMTNCLFFDNVAGAGSTGAAEVDSDGGGAEGSPGGSALGGGLFITNGMADALIENSIFFFNYCEGGDGGSTTLTNAIGGNGGLAEGGGVWSGAALTQMGFCTLATNLVYGGIGGTNFAGGLNGASGATNGWDIYRSAGVFDLSASILAGDASGNNMSDAVGVTDAGYNIISDASVIRSTIITTTRLNTNPDLDSGLLPDGPVVGGTKALQPMLTLQLLPNSPAGALVPGVPGLTFPETDETLDARSTPTCAGAFEILPLTLASNALLPTITSISPATNVTGAGSTGNLYRGGLHYQSPGFWLSMATRQQQHFRQRQLFRHNQQYSNHQENHHCQSRILHGHRQPHTFGRGRHQFGGGVGPDQPARHQGPARQPAQPALWGDRHFYRERRAFPAGLQLSMAVRQN